MTSLVNQTIEYYGRVDVLVNNAAINFAMKSFSDMDGMNSNLKLKKS